MIYFNQLTFLFFLFSFSWPAEARWLQPEEAATSVELQRTTIEIPQDAKETTVTKVRIKILNERQRAALGTLRFNYSPKSQKIKIVQAETHNGGAVVRVSSDQISDQAIRISEVGFDDLREVMVSFPQVKVGSELSYEHQETNLHPAFKDVYAKRFNLSSRELVKNVEYEFKSKIPLHFYFNDPQGLLAFEKNEKSGVFYYKVHLKKPLINDLFDESHPLVPDKKWTWFVASSSPSYNAMYMPLALSYEKILASPLPAGFNSILTQAKTHGEPIKQVGEVMAGLSSLIRYMGDWRQVDGGFIPHEMSRVAETLSGDCKDLSIVTAKILRELGLKAWVALVTRGENRSDLSPIPYSPFNHAIVYAVINGKKLWLNPTNFQSFAEGVFEDIADRDSLILNPENMEIQHIDFTPASTNTSTVTISTRFNQRKHAVKKIKIDYHGFFATPGTGIMLHKSPTEYADTVVSYFASKSDIVHFHLDDIQLKSRIVQPYSINMQLEERYHPLETSLGPALNLDPPFIIGDLIRVDIEKRESDFKLMPPSIVETVESYKTFKSKGSAVKSCKVLSPWLNYNMRLSGSPIEIVRTMEVKKYSISKEEMKSQDFESFQKALRKCAKTKYLIYQ